MSGLTALCDRAEARDFSDIFVPAQVLSREPFLERAAEVDLGFDVRDLVVMLRTLDRCNDEELPIDTEDVAAV